MIFGKKIKELREERGLAQRQLSAALEIDTSMYSKIERGERKAKRNQIPIIAQMFEVDEKELFIKSMIPDERSDGYFGTIEFCGVAMGMNIKWIGNEDDKIPKSITLQTSRQDLKTFEQLKEGISSYLGNPQSDKY